MKLIWTSISFIVLFGSIMFAVAGVLSISITKHSLDYIDKMQASNLQCNQLILDGLSGTQKNISDLQEFIATTTKGS